MEWGDTFATFSQFHAAPSIDCLDLDGVFSDNFIGACDVTKAFIKAGHRKIGIISGDPNLTIGRERFRGFGRR